MIQEADDYYFPPLTGSYLRLSRFLILILTYFITPTFLLMMQNPDWIPPAFQFIVVKEDINVPLIWQFLILELAIDGLRLAAVNTPNMLSTPLSVMAALILGEFFCQERLVQCRSHALYGICQPLPSYSQSNIELNYAIKFMRILLLLLTCWFGLTGFIAGILITFISLLSCRTFSGRGYLYPLIPFRWKTLKRQLFRVKL